MAISAKALAPRADAALDADTRYLMAMRCGYHHDMLAIGLAGFISRNIGLLYREQLTHVLTSVGAGAVDASLPHLRLVVDYAGQPAITIVEEAFDLGPLVTLLQSATHGFVRRSAGVAELQERVHAEVLRCVLDEWLGDAGGDVVTELDANGFSTQFRARVRASERCAGSVHRDTLDWIEGAAREATTAAGLERFDLADLERMLGLRPLDAADYSRMLAGASPAAPERTQRIFQDGLAPIPTNQAGWSLVAAIHDAVVGRNWSDDGGRHAPTHQTTTNQGRGRVSVTLRGLDGALEAEPEALTDLWERVRSLDDLTCDALLVCLAAWTSEGSHPDAPVWVTADAILDARGVRRIQRRDEPSTWQHGHRREDRLAAGRALAQLDQLWLEVIDVGVIPGGRRSQSSRISVESRAMAILERVTERDEQGEATFLAARVMPGEWARAWWELGLRQVGLLAQAALSYDPYHEALEKRLAKYLAFSFRWNARRAGEPLVRRVEMLLDNAGLEPDPARPQRARDRLEKALERLRADDVVATWAYTSDPGDLPARRWLPLWREMRVRLEPPASLVLGNARLRRGGNMLTKPEDDPV